MTSQTVERQTIGHGVILTDSEHERYKQVLKKQEKKEFQLAFCGHFSAGKSSILNRILGAEVLPTSPIPTSANVIEIMNGPLGLTLKQSNGELKVWEGEIPWDQVRKWGMDGHEITGMTISAPLPFLGEVSKIYDTPGVDSTDPSHQAVTAEQLYTTDVIVYVMDYNHVQSETNLYFLKQLSEEKKPLIIVVNQVDKHDENELSFEVFEHSIIETFKRWDIEYRHMFYTSMKVDDHPLNQFASFEKTIKPMLYHGEDLVPLAGKRLYQSFYLGVEARLREEQEEAIEAVLDEMRRNGHDPKKLEKREELEQALAGLENASDELRASSMQRLQDLMKSVTLFPFSTTDLTREWLESMRPGFKIGWFASKKKTEEERERRLQKLMDELQDKVKSQLEFHLHAMFQEIDREKLSNEEELERAIEAVHYTVKPSLFKNNVMADNTNREYVFTFTKERTDLIIKDLREKAAHVFDVQQKGMARYWEAERQKLLKEMNELEEIEAYVQKVEAIRKAFAKQCDDVRKEGKQYDDKGAYEEALTKWENASVQLDEQADNAFATVELPIESVIKAETLEVSAEEETIFDETAAKQWLNRLEKGLEIGEEAYYPLKEEKKQLLERIKRFRQQEYMLSLFGAFSAGKSSFANALLGEQVLPVSPHPTTATVTTIRRSDESHQHERAVIRVKKAEAIDEEVQAVGRQLDLDVNFESLPSFNVAQKNVGTRAQKTYIEYLLMLKAALKKTEWTLGGELEVSLQELQQYVGNENYACLIQDVTLYYDCSLTRQGIVLVDTPGVNSIHGRHTNVAFTQLRQSDAIFYVTYYNHSFSKADQYFLQQMAKVNESFRHDKLYFILNAADLANSEAELQGVRSHLREQLVANGIEQPRLYHLSSKAGLKAKQEQEERPNLFQAFESAFYKNTIGQLKSLSFSLMEEETKHFLQKLEDSLSFLKEETTEQDARRQKLKQTVEAMKQEVGALEAPVPLRESLQELEQLILYLRQRIRYMLNDEFVHSINVSTVKGTNKKAQIQSLSQAIKDWRNTGEHYINQELAALSIRVEETVKKQMEAWGRATEKRLKTELPHLYTDWSFIKAQLPDLKIQRLLAIQSTSYEHYFTSSKAFFEEGGLKRLKEALVEEGTTLASEQLQKIEAERREHVEASVKQVEQEIKQQLILAIDREYERFDALTNEGTQILLQKQYDALSEL
ncbi:dynamin family protein [Halalkalibacterium ligniniphilum]|uniref:dynamin family protein n=1 Tax=Halalkalibacterium ligniniphilum TaxID=1134413 RepID=UPI00034C6A40|nr:dynamin family protein [Halalkalibacterium ligniniphilum]